MNTSLVSGKEICSQEVHATVRILPVAYSLGEGAAITRGIFDAVHQTNRTLSSDRVMLDLPNFDPQKEGIQRLGDSIVVAGPHDAVRNILESKTFTRWQQTGAVNVTLDVVPPPLEHGLKRNRTGEKSTKAAKERAKRRQERKGATWTPREHQGASLPAISDGVAFITVGNGKKIAFTRTTSEAYPMVSTYGLL